MSLISHLSDSVLFGQVAHMKRWKSKRRCLKRKLKICTCEEKIKRWLRWWMIIMLENSNPAMTLIFLGQKEKKMIVLFWLAVFCFYFQIHQLTFEMMASQSMTVFCFFFNWVGYNSHFQNYFLFNPSLYFVLEIVKHVPKIFIYRSW